MGITESNSSIAAIHNIKCKRGNTFLREFEYFYDDDVTPLPIEGSEFTMHVWDSKRNRSILKFTAEELVPYDTNKLKLEKTATEMLLDVGTYLYDLDKKLPDGNVLTIMQGEFTIEYKTPKPK